MEKEKLTRSGTHLVTRNRRLETAQSQYQTPRIYNFSPSLPTVRYSPHHIDGYHFVIDRKQKSGAQVKKAAA